MGQKLVSEFNNYLSNNSWFFNEDSTNNLKANMENYLQTRDFFSCSDDFKDFINFYCYFSNDSKFAFQLMSDFPANEFQRVLEVGCGDNFSIANILSQNDYNVILMDSKLNTELFKEKFGSEDKVTAIKKRFICDKAATSHKGTDLSSYNCVIGFKPCKATEHIIRQCINQNKPFILLVCNCTHKSVVDGRTFPNKDEWLKYLQEISKEVKIIRNKEGFDYATNLESIHTGLLKSPHRSFQYIQ